MLSNLATKMEINVSSIDDINIICNQATKDNVPAIIADPTFVPPIIAQAVQYQNAFRVICTIDFPTGLNFSLDKFKNLPRDFMAADGFDIMLSQRESTVEIINEIKSITAFIKNVNPLYEIRICLGVWERGLTFVKSIIEAFRGLPISWIRFDSMLESDQEIPISQYQDIYKLIKNKTGIKVKLSTNIDYDIVNSFLNMPVRFDVNYTQYKAIESQRKNKEDNSKN